MRSVNDTTEKVAPQGSIDQIGEALSRIIYAFAETDEDAKIFTAKWDIKDGFWRMGGEEGQEYNFAYVLPQPPGCPTTLVIPTSLQMGWVESPPLFCAASETARDIRQSLLGNAMHVGVVAILLSDYSNKCLVSRAPFTPSQLAFQEPSTRRHAGERLVKAYLARQGHRGFEIRLEDVPERSRTKPGRQELPASSWQWKDVISAAWQLPGEHINTLEMRALTLALRWRTRSVKHLHKKFIHLCDSMVSLGIFTASQSSHQSADPASLELRHGTSTPP